MEIQIDVKNQVEQARRSLDELGKRQLPIAIARTINDVAQDVQEAERREMERVFDRPTPMTLNSVKVWKANKTTLTGRIFVRDEAPKGTPPSKYLRAQVEGGERRPKRFEMAARFSGHLSSDGFLVPSRATPLNQHGNVTGGRITQILDQIHANFKDTSQHVKAGRRYFFGQPKGHPGLGIGVWLRTKDGLRPILLLKQGSPSYGKRFRFHEVGDRAVRQNLARRFQGRLAQAIATARR